MQNVFTFAGTDQSMANIAIYVNLYTRIRSVLPFTCNVMRNAFGTLLEHLIISKHLTGSNSYMV